MAERNGPRFVPTITARGLTWERLYDEREFLRAELAIAHQRIAMLEAQVAELEAGRASRATEEAGG